MNNRTVIALAAILTLQCCETPLRFGAEAAAHELKGVASHYSRPQAVACRGEKRFNPSAMTAAHRTLDCGTWVRVTNIRNGKTVDVKITDRGPWTKDRRGRYNRVIDLSLASAQEIGITVRAGLGQVTIRVLPK